MHASADAKTPEEAATRDALAASSSDRVLVVEDSPTVARLVASKLEAAGYQTTVAPDAGAALRPPSRIAPI